MKLVMGNKNYSSWSIRPWFFMRHANIAFEEIVLPMDQPVFYEEIAKWSPSKRVPLLVTDDGGHVWDTIAIGETLAELFPEANVWPKDADLRRLARSAVAEMHSGFPDLRRVLTCNARRAYKVDTWHIVAKDTVPAVLADIARMHELWETLLTKSGGPFLLGSFSYADAYFAPVISRFDTYGIQSSARISSYRLTVEDLETYRLWLREAALEPYELPKYDYPLPARATRISSLPPPA